MAMHRDPVCGMQVDDHDAKARAEYDGRTYYFCATSCERRFKEDPARYAETARA